MKHVRPRPENGARWLDYVPGWARLGVPILTVLISLGGFALGFGEGRGRADERVTALVARVERIEHVVAEVASLRGEVQAIGRFLGVPKAGTP